MVSLKTNLYLKTIFATFGLLLGCLYGTLFVNAQTSDQAQPIFNRSLDILENYTEIPNSDPKQPEYIQYQFTSDIQIVPIQNEIIEKRTSNSRSYTDDQGKEHIIIYSSDQLIQKEDKNWYTLEYATTTLEKFYEEIYYEKPVSKWTIIQPVNAQTYSGSGDGIVFPSGNTTWATQHDATTGSANYTNNDYSPGCMSYNGAPVYYQCARAFLPFDTSGLSDTQCFDTASLYLYAEGYYDDAKVHVVKGTQAATNELVSDDFDNLEWNSFGNVLVESSGYKEIVLSAQGMANISTSSWTKFAVIDDWDLTDTPNSVQDLTIKFDASEYTGTTRDPYLDITMIDCPSEETEETGTTTQATAGSLPITNDISTITGYIEHYTTSTTTPSEVEYLYFHIPFFVWVVFITIFIFIFGRLLLELIIWMRQ